MKNIKEHYKERLLTSMNEGRYLASQQIKENNMKNINELTAFTNDQLQNPLTRTIAQDQLGRLRKIAADHNANPNKKAGYGDRISTMMTTRGAAVAASLKNSVLRLPFSRDEKAVPVSHDTKLDSREINQDDRFRSSEYGDERRRDRRQLAARRREDNRGVADANRRGFKTPEGITEKNNMNIKEYYKQILNSEINEKLIGKQHKIDADGNKKINRKDFAIINARKKSAMNQVDEMALTKNAFNKMLKGVKDARRMGDATRGDKSALHWRDEEKKSIALVKALQSPILYDIGPKGGLVQINRLRGSNNPARDLTYAANFRTKVPKAVLQSAKKLARLHGMFYTTHHGNDVVTNPIGKTVAVGGKLGPTSGFIRQSRKVSRGFDQM